MVRAVQDAARDPGLERQSRIHKGKVFLGKLHELTKSREAGAMRVATKEIVYTVGLGKALRMTDPRKAGIVITATMIQKALLAAGLESKEETRACLEAVSSLAGDLALAAAPGPETLGLGALLPLASAAIDGYDVGRTCFSGDGPTTHAIVGQARRELKSALRTPKHGPI